ncbi:uncharacterized protein (TIGR02271 family) [Pseudomonas duriflava]|uniref:Uncharacterized protein (TIGR02271 family) n=1 Tax=Pseudomonas duriflava TaxID=459528 RepID=A0A562QN66_9PSED|nr:DUF2382 domain-containing protein [Pseudomonas duriflava]TWI57640.1 uncharacterized protein (TIGR02271 family) [Pseudomonas duriflava]
MRKDELENLANETIPVMEEEAVLLKKKVESGRVRISKTVETQDYTVSDSLRYEEAVIERVKCGTTVDPEHLPQVRQENGITIIPVVEEVLVVEKRLVLKEELHVQRVVREAHHTVPVTLNREKVTVEHSQPEPESSAHEQ